MVIMENKHQQHQHMKNKENKEENKKNWAVVDIIFFNLKIVYFITF